MADEELIELRSGAPRASRDVVHVWLAVLDRPADHVGTLSETLAPDERMRADRFHFEQDRSRFIVARAFLREILASYVRVEPAQLRFEYGRSGKPELAQAMGVAGLRFNMSHSDRLAIFAVTRDRAVGIDLERARVVPKAEHIAERFFSVREQSVIQGLPALIRDEAFLNGWTRKEAYLKATGDGLTRRLDSVEVSLAPDDPVQLIAVDGDPGEAARWRLVALRPAADYVAALVVEGHGWKLQVGPWRSP